MDTESILRSVDGMRASEGDPFRSGKVFPNKVRTGDPEIDENFSKVRPEPACFITGMDEVTGVGWLYHINQVFFYRYCPQRTEYDKMYIQNNDLCRSSQLAVTRPIFFEGAINGGREVYAILTTLREIITVKLFTSFPIEKTINPLPLLGPTEKLINASSAKTISRYPGKFKDEYDQVDYRYACATNRANIYIHTISVVPDRQKGKSVVSNNIQYISGDKSPSSSLLSSFMSLLKKPSSVPQPNLVRVKITFEDNVLTLLTDKTVRKDALTFRGPQCNVTNILDLQASDFGVQESPFEILDSALVSVSEPNGPWTIFTLYRTRYQLVLARDHRLARDSSSAPQPLFIKKLIEEQPELPDDDDSRSQASFAEKSRGENLLAVPFSGKIIVFEEFCYVVVGLGSYTWAFQTNLTTGETNFQEIGFPVLGLSTFKFDEQDTKLCLFTQDGLFDSELNMKRRRGDRISLERTQTPFYFPNSNSLRAGILPTIQTISSREAEDLLMNTFYSYENERSTGILPKNTCWPDLTDIVKQIIHKYSNSLTTNLAIMQAVGGRRSSNNAPQESFLVFDLEQRSKRVAKFYHMLEKNNLFEQMSHNCKYEFLQAFESLSAAVALATEHEKNPEFFNAESSIQHLRVYEAPLKIPEVLLSLIDGFINLQGLFRTNSELVFLTIASIFDHINSTRMEKAQLLKIDTRSRLPNPWWIHHSSLWLSGQQGFRNLQVLYHSSFSYKQMVSKDAQHKLAQALIPELETILRVVGDSVVHQNFLKELYDGLINDGLLIEAYSLAKANTNFPVMARLLVKPEVHLKEAPKNAILAFGDRLVHHLVNTAVQVILSEDDSGGQQAGAITILNTKTDGDLIEKYLKIHYPQLYWLTLAENSKFEEALTIVPSTGLECIAFSSMMTAITRQHTTETSEDNTNELVSEFVHRRVLPSEIARESVDNQVQYLLGTDNIQEIDRARYSLCVLIQSAKLGQDRADDLMRIKPSLRQVFRYLLDRDKLKPQTEELLHRRLNSLLHQSLTLIGSSSSQYLQGLQSLGMALDQADKQILQRLDAQQPG